MASGYRKTGKGATTGRIMTLLEYLQERQRERFCKDGCDPCPFCDGKTPHFCPIDGHMTETARKYSKEFV